MRSFIICSRRAGSIDLRSLFRQGLKDRPVVKNRRGIRFEGGGQLVERLCSFGVAQAAVADAQLDAGQAAAAVRRNEAAPPSGPGTPSGPPSGARRRRPATGSSPWPREKRTRSGRRSRVSLPVRLGEEEQNERALTFEKIGANDMTLAPTCQFLTKGIPFYSHWKKRIYHILINTLIKQRKSPIYSYGCQLRITKY